MAIDASTLIFFTLATLLVVSSLLVVLLRNVVHCAMALVAALLIISIFFVILQAPMVGVLQVLVYAGAIMVLFLFVIMFLNPAPQQQSGVWLGFSGLLALLLGGVLASPVNQDGNSRRSGGVDRIVRQPGDAGEEPVRRFRFALRDRFDSVARGHRGRGGFGQTGAPVLKWCRSIII